MVTLEQVKLLETKVAKALEYIERLDAENSTLREKLDGYRNRIDELEVIVKQFKDEQGRIEEGILSALDRLSRFEDAVERGIDRAAEASDEGISRQTAEDDADEAESPGEPPSGDDEAAGPPPADAGADDDGTADADADGSDADLDKTGELDIF